MVEIFENVYRLYRNNYAKIANDYNIKAAVISTEWNLLKIRFFYFLEVGLSHLKLFSFFTEIKCAIIRKANIPSSHQNLHQKAAERCHTYTDRSSNDQTRIDKSFFCNVIYQHLCQIISKNQHISPFKPI